MMTDTPKKAAISISAFDLMPNVKLPTVENQPLEPIADFGNVLNELERIEQAITNDAPPETKEKTKLKKQHAAILAVIKRKEFEPMAIPQAAKKEQSRKFVEPIIQVSLIKIQV